MKDTWGREINVDTQAWENSHGGKSPRGTGNWQFHFGGITYGEPLRVDLTILKGTYSVALKRAIKEAGLQGRNLVVVCP